MALNWAPPDEPGSTVTRYEVLRSADPSDFGTSVACLRETDDLSEFLDDAGAATAGPELFYLVRALNRCAQGLGTTGSDSFGTPRAAAACP